MNNLANLSNSAHREVISSQIYTKRIFCCFKTKRLRFTTADGKVYNVAVRTFNAKNNQKVPKRFFAIKIDKKTTVLINKNSFKKRVNYSQNLVQEIIAKKPKASLETLMSVKQNLNPLINALTRKEMTADQCQTTAFKIALFVDTQRTKITAKKKSPDFIYKKMKDGRPFIAYRDKDKKFNFIIDVSFDASGSKTIGSGGFKQVYRYYNFQKQKDDIAVSIQTCQKDKDITMAEQELDHYEQLREIEEILNLKASHKAQITDKDGSSHSSIISVMKKYDGDLSECITKYDRNINLKAFEIIVNGVVKMHKKGIVHRDLKFQNVLYRVTKKNDLTLKIIDFGLACKVTDKAALSHKAGTSYYMPPEVIGYDKKTQPEKIDSWALGVMLYRIHFKKRIPLSKKVKELSNVKIKDKKRKEELVKATEQLLSELKKNKDPWVQLMVELLQPDPKNRMSAKKAAKEVEKLLKD